MCGIAGQVRSDGRSVEQRLVEDMCDAIVHRGPDSRGVHREDVVGLGIQRLRVIDLATGDQPIYNEDRSIVVVLNGEIYNYRELRDRLERHGHRFRTQGDTEILVHLYEEAGPAFVEKLVGMFALALWDARRRRLVLVRDRVGKKPLFYAERDGALSFASELAALMRDPELPREVDEAALDCYLAYGYIPAPMTAYRAVRKLPPASVLVHEDGRTRVKRYWRLDFGRKRAAGDVREVHEELREHIRTAVRRRMIADVPLGAFLSGGVDSSTVVAAMAEASPRPVKTFSIGFEHEGFNELAAARTVAERYGTDHHEFVVRPDAVEVVPALVRHYGEPFADSSAVPSFYLARLTREHVTVALNGDGGDESFGGYNRYLSNRLASHLDRLPGALRRRLAAWSSHLPDGADMASIPSRARRLGSTVALDPPTRFARYHAALTPTLRASLYTADYLSVLDESVADDVVTSAWREASGTDIVDVMLGVDIATYLPGDLLVKIDIATMANSLEARSPLLDHELMEFAASLPADLKLQGMRKKAVLRDAVAEWVPRPILEAPKRGFSVPLAHWFRTDLRSYAEEVLLDPATTERGRFRSASVRALLDAHARRAADHSVPIWTLLMDELWHREFIDRPRSAPAPLWAAGYGRA